MKFIKKHKGLLNCDETVQSELFQDKDNFFYVFIFKSVFGIYIYKNQSMCNLCTRIFFPTQHFDPVVILPIDLSSISDLDGRHFICLFL